MSIRINKEDCINLERALGLEWLDTNGIGGYASSTVVGCHTRRYHGLLVVRLADPPGRFVLLSKVEDSLFSEEREGERELFLSVHKYPGVFFPSGHRYQSAFEQAEVPRFDYQLGGTSLRKELALVQGADTLLVCYTASRNRAGARLRIKPLLAYRDFHRLSGENIHLRVRTYPAEQGFMIDPYEGMPRLHVRVGGAFQHRPTPVWYRDFEYIAEARRGFDCHEDLFCAGLIECELPVGEPVVIAASTAPVDADPRELWAAELTRRRAEARGRHGSHLERELSRAARQFFTAGPTGGRTITAGFPWFLEWGRDAMIALPGLILGAGDDALFLEVLETFAGKERDGLLPNFIGETPERDAWNSADAALWFAWAVQQYLARTGDHEGVRERLFGTLKRIFRGYRDGTAPGVRRTPEGLLRAGSPEENLTWMDAQVDGRPVTPRHGCAVELNALWYNLVRFVEELGSRFGDPVAAEAAAAVAGFPEAFLAAFWIADEERLADVWRDGERDSSMRPNQVFATSLPYSPLDRDRALCVLRAVRRELVTPVGLRTLSPREPGYRGRYQGGPAERDSAYHNGTVWPFLLGHFADAWLRLTDQPVFAVEKLSEYRDRLAAHLEEGCLGSIAEVFDGDPPPLPGGAPSQAWSVGEILRMSHLIEAARRGAASQGG